MTARDAYACKDTRYVLHTAVPSPRALWLPHADRRKRWKEGIASSDQCIRLTRSSVLDRRLDGLVDAVLVREVEVLKGQREGRVPSTHSLHGRLKVEEAFILSVINYRYSRPIRIHYSPGWWRQPRQRTHPCSVLHG